ncbi:MAG: hypothetical protein Q8N84_00790 [bacterium]|nr:hypothetical protein [bacterium]
MIISAAHILSINEKYNLIENLAERELNPEGTGFDLRAGEIYRLKSGGFLGVTERKTSEVELVAKVAETLKKITLNPGEYFLVKTMEKVNLPAEKIIVHPGSEPIYLMAHVYPRRTLQHCGVLLLVAKTDPGYYGELTFGLVNLAQFPFELELGARIASLVFHEVYGELSRAYGGQWKGGRVATDKLEKQI